MAQGRSARLACAAERTNGELCATAWNRRLFSDGGGGGGGGGGVGGVGGGGGSMTEIHITVCRLGILKRHAFANDSVT